MNKPLILVVEDDAPIRNLITTTLKTQDTSTLQRLLPQKRSNKQQSMRRM